MIEFFKEGQDVKADHSICVMLNGAMEYPVLYRMTCDVCGETCLCESDPQPNSVLELMLQIEDRALDRCETRLQTEYCVFIKREPNKYPDYKIVCPSCEEDADPKFSAEGYMRLCVDACGMTDVPWEDWVVPSGEVR